MAQPAQDGTTPPKLRIIDGRPDIGSVADVLEWFLNFDEKTSRMRHPHTNELFQWKQEDDKANGVGTFPFENAEARFALGTIQAVSENNDEASLQVWITEVLEALGRSRETRTELEHSYNLAEDMEASPVAKAEKLTSNTERRLYLTSCWLEQLCTAEARTLGWIYQELYNKPFEPAQLNNEEEE